MRKTSNNTRHEKSSEARMWLKCSPLDRFTICWNYWPTIQSVLEKPAHRFSGLTPDIYAQNTWRLISRSASRFSVLLRHIPVIVITVQLTQWLNSQLEKPRYPWEQMNFREIVDEGTITKMTYNNGWSQMEFFIKNLKDNIQSHVVCFNIFLIKILPKI